MEIDLQKAFVAEGTFRLPGSNSTVAGELSYRPGDGLELRLSQGFPPGHPTTRQQTAMPVILGTLVNGTRLTLIRSFIRNLTSGAGASGSVWIVSNSALVGAHVENPTEATYRSVRVRFTSLEEWFSESPIKRALLASNGGFKATLEYERPHVDEFSLPESGCTVRTASSFNESARSLGMMEWEHRRYLVVESADGKSAEHWLRMAFRFQNLISLLAGSPVAAREIILGGYANGDDQEVQFVVAARTQKLEQHIHPQLMLVTYPKARASFGMMLDKWFATTDAYAHAMDLHFGTIYSPPDALELRFLSFTQALESFHRAWGSGFYMDRVDYTKAIESFSSHMPPEITGDHRASLKNRLKYGNEFSLRKRIGLLLESLPAQLSERVVTNAPNFLGRVVDTRNYLTHFDDESKANTYEGVLLLHAAERLKVLLTVLFLHYLEVDEAEILDALGRSSELRWILEQNLA